MATHRSSNNPRRDDPKPRGNGKGGSLLTGLFIGLVMGLIVAAGLAWYLSNRTVPFQNAETIPPDTIKTDKPASNVTSPDSKPSPAKTAASRKPEPVVERTPASPAKRPPTPRPDPTADAAPNVTKPRVDYTFYGILPGDKPAKPVPLPESKDIWWLQVAALKSPADADKLKARLILLGLQVATQKVESGDIPLYRIRVGPYKREDDALGDLDTLAENNFEPRLFKEPNIQSVAPNNKEKP